MSEDLNLNVKLAMESQSFQKQITSINQQIKLVQSGFNAASTNLNGFGSATDKLTTKAASLGKQMELQSEIVSKYSLANDKAKASLEKNTLANTALADKVKSTSLAYEESVAATGKNSEESKLLKTQLDELTQKFAQNQAAIQRNVGTIDNYSTRMNNAQTSVNNLGRQINETNAQIATQSSRWTTTGTAMVKAGDKMKAVGKTTTDIGKKMSTSITLPIVGLATAAVVTAATFAHEMADIRKEVNATSGSVANTDAIMSTMSKSSLAWSEEFGQSTTDINASLLTLVKDGYNGKVAMDIMGISLNTARGSNESLTTSVNSLGTSLEAYGMKTTNAAQTTANMTNMADAFAYVANHTKASISSLGEAFSIVGPTASALKIPFTEVAAAIGKLQSNGIDANTAATSLKAGLVNLTKPTAKMTKAMKDMSLSAFDAQGNMKTLPQILSNIEQGTKGFTNQQKMADIATVFGKESLASWTVLLKAGAPALTTLSDNAGNATGEVKKLADSMKNTDVNKFNELKNSVKALGITFGQDVLPELTPVIDGLTNMAKSFSTLSEGQKRAIVNVALFVAAIGPTAFVIGKITTAVGIVSSTLGALAVKMGITTAATIAEGTASAIAAPEIAALGVAGVTAEAGVAGAGVAGVAAGSGIAALGVAFGGAVIAAAPFILAGAAVVGTGLLVKNAMDKQATPAVDLFADTYTATAVKVGSANDQMGSGYTTTVTKISEGTKKAVGAYMDLDAKATASLQDLYVNSKVITDKNSATVISQYQGLANQVNAKLDTRYTTEYDTMKAFFDKSSALSKSDEAKALNNLTTDNNNKKKVETDYTNQIQAILKGAADKHRALTLTEQEQINTIQSKMTNNAVNTLSNGEVESKVIMQRLADYGKNITAQQAGDEIKNANKARDGQISAANTQYNKSLAAIIQMRDGSHSITSDQANKLIADAKKQRDGTVKQAESMRNGVVNKITAMNKSISDSVDTATGNMKTKWDEFKTWWDKLIFGDKTLTVKAPTAAVAAKTAAAEKAANAVPSANNGYLYAHADGTDNAQAGPSLVGELGPEILDLKKGDTMTSAEDSMKLLNPKTVDQTKDYAKLGLQITQGLTNGIKNGTPILQTGMTTMTKGIMDNFGLGITNSTKPTLKVTNDLSDKVTKVFTDLSTNNVPLGTSVITSLSTGMKSTTGILNNTTNTLSNGTKDIVNNLVSASNPLGNNVVNSLSTGMRNATGNLNSTTTNLSTGTKGIFNNLATDVHPIGKDVTQGLSDGMKSSESNLTAVTKDLTDKVIDSFKLGFDIHSPSRRTFPIGENVALGVMKGIESKDLTAFTKKQVGSMMTSFSGSMGSTQLTAEMMAGLSITGTPLTWAPALQKLIMFESGGNTNSINLSDSNASKGTPSQGLMQEIPETYNRFKMASVDKGIDDPLSNIVAGIRYIKDRYGTIFNTPGMRSIANGGAYQGYANGTLNASSGLKWVGERGPELLNFRGGETITDAKQSARIASNNNQATNKQPLTIQLVLQSGKQIAEYLINDIDTLLGNKNKLNSRRAGV